ncbi:hypothetical protein EMCG_01327 [[Emmonsia] crescens]|uniref:Uncharacterized protein n=1 Tax=[Emmonsia] crescens TaxID=73230 RepID=A0A0G2I382_9EURO|nr:hypothetical protein EMCG_01327 [Emmonsia crescens UAMH 3008]
MYREQGYGQALIHLPPSLNPILPAYSQAPQHSPLAHEHQSSPQYPQHWHQVEAEEQISYNEDPMASEPA